VNLNYRVDAERSVIYVEASLLVTSEELMQGASWITSDPAFHPDIRVLLDFTGATDWALRADHLSLLGSLPCFSPRSRRAIVVREGLPQAMFAVHKFSAHPGSVRTFSKRALAVAWLNQDVPPEQKIE
jgi:hypothetical protein